MSEASKHLPEGYTVKATSGKREGRGGSQHNVGNAIDLQIFDPEGKAIPNRGPDTTGLYTQLGRHGYGEMLERYPELKGKFANGGAFGTSPFNRNEPDLMHYDIGGERGQLAPHISKQCPMPGVAYGKSSSALAGVDADERQRIDRSMKQQVDIKGSAGIKIEVSAPKGTKVGAQADGVFKKTEISRSQQMEPSAVSSGGEE